MNIPSTFKDFCFEPFVFLKQNLGILFYFLFFDTAFFVSVFYLSRLWRMLIPDPSSLLQRFGQGSFIFFFILFVFLSFCLFLLIYSFFKYCILDILEEKNKGHPARVKRFFQFYGLNLLIFMPPAGLLFLLAFLFLFSTWLVSNPLGASLFLFILFILSIPLLLYVVFMVNISHYYFLSLDGTGKVMKKSFRKMFHLADYGKVYLADMAILFLFAAFLMLGKWIIKAFGFPLLTYLSAYRKYSLGLAIIAYYILVVVNRIDFYILLHRESIHEKDQYEREI